MNEHLNINTIEELVAYVLKNKYNAERKWVLIDQFNNEYIDPEAGKVWQAEWDAVPCVSYASLRHGTEEQRQARMEYDRIQEEMEERRPEMKSVIDWSLREGGSSWNHQYIRLSPELGKMLDKIWKTKPTYRGSSNFERTGYVSIPGMLKRLDKTLGANIVKKIDAARTADKLQKEKNSRNYSRRQVREHAEAIHALMVKCPEAFGEMDLTLFNLQNLKEEE